MEALPFKKGAQDGATKKVRKHFLLNGSVLNINQSLGHRHLSPKVPNIELLMYRTSQTFGRIIICTNTTKAKLNIEIKNNESLLERANETYPVLT